MKKINDHIETNQKKNNPAYVLPQVLGICVLFITGDDVLGRRGKHSESVLEVILSCPDTFLREAMRST